MTNTALSLAWCYISFTLLFILHYCCALEESMYFQNETSQFTIDMSSLSYHAIHADKLCQACALL